jgi:hypothetical protein
VEAAPVSPPAVSSVDYDPQPEPVESTTTKKRKRDRFAARPPANPEISVERPNAIHAHIAFPHSKVHAQIDARILTSLLDVCKLGGYMSLILCRAF